MNPFRPIQRRVAALTLAATLLAGSASAAIQPGDPAPDFTLSDIFGNSYTLSALRGNVVFLFMIGYG